MEARASYALLQFEFAPALYSLFLTQNHTTRGTHLLRPEYPDVAQIPRLKR